MTIADCLIQIVNQRDIGAFIIDITDDQQRLIVSSNSNG